MQIWTKRVNLPLNKWAVIMPSFLQNPFVSRIAHYIKKLLIEDVKLLNYLIEDLGHPLIPYCMKEYTPCNIDLKVTFIIILRSARNPIECAFVRFKAKCSFLSKREDLPTTFCAYFILHNYCERKKCVVAL